MHHTLNNMKSQHNMEIKDITCKFQKRIFELQKKLKKILQHQNDIKNKNIQNLQKTRIQLKEKVEEYQKQYAAKMQKSQMLNQTEKQSLYSKIDELHHKQNKLEKELLSEIHEKDQLQSAIDKKQEMLRQLNLQTSSLRLIGSSCSNKQNKNKFNYEKVLAQAEQQRQFLEKKVKESEKSIQSLTNHDEQRMKKIKEELQQNLQTQDSKYSN